MNSIDQSFLEAVLADIAYVDGFTVGMTGDPLRQRIEFRVSLPLAQEIADRIQVLAVHPGPTTDYQGIVFKDLIDGTLYVAHRGTEPTFGDLLYADVDLALISGLARDQAAAMVNWWNDIAKPAGTIYTRAAPVSILDILDNRTFKPDGTAASSGLLANEVAQAAAAGKLRVVGHSLGGHLTTVFASVFSEQVSHSSTFNGAGLFSVGTVTNFLRAFLQGAPLTQLAQIIGTSVQFPGAARQDNLYAMNGVSLTSSDVLFLQQAGKRIPVFNEYRAELNADPFNNHYAYKLVDTLALYRALEMLYPAISTSSLNPLTEASASVYSASLEQFLDGLRRALIGPTVTPTPSIDAGGDWKNSVMPTERTTYHANIKAIMESAPFRNSDGTPGPLIGKVVIAALSGTSSLVNSAKTEFGEFIALKTLAPFAIKPNLAVSDAAATLNAVWNNVHSQDFLAWSADKTARSTGDTTKVFDFTDTWYGDRAEMLRRLLTINQYNEPFVAEGIASAATPISFAEDPIVFHDRTQGIEIRRTPATSMTQLVVFGTQGDDRGTLAIAGNEADDHLYGDAGADELKGNGGNDYLEGGSGSDRLEGGANNDVLFGGAGNDEMLGGTGRNRLEGGVGNDTYFLTGDPGASDTILDSDDDGQLNLDGRSVLGFNALGNGLYETLGGAYQMAVLDAGNGKYTATVSRTIDGVVLANILNVQPDKVLGYSLGAPIPPPNPTTFFRGAYSDFIAVWEEQGGGFYGPLTAGAGIADGGAANDVIVGGRFADMELRGGIGSDLLLDFEMPDAIAESQQTVRLTGGPGSDFLYGRGGTMLLDGGDDGDYISSARFESSPHFNLFARNALGGLDEVPVDTNLVPDLGSLLSLSVSTFSDGSVAAYDPTLGVWGFAYRPIASGSVAASGALMLQTGSIAVFASRTAQGNIEYVGYSDAPPFGALPVTRYTTTLTTGPTEPFSAANITLTLSSGLTANGVLAHSRFLIPHGTTLETMARDASENLNELAFIDAGNGDDIVLGGAGRDVVVGGPGNDRIDGAGGQDALEGGDGSDFVAGGRYNDTLFGGSGHDTLHGGGEGDSLYGDEGDDVLIGDLYTLSGTNYQEIELSGSDYLDGGSGNDTLDAGGGDDWLEGGAGSDTLLGGRGNDMLRDSDAGSTEIYQYNVGDGAEVIVDGGGIDRIRFGAGIAQTDLALDRIGSDMRIGVASGGSILVKDAFASGAKGWIEWFQFSSGPLADVRTLPIRDVGTDGSDRLQGSSGADVLDGRAGDDVLEGGAGNDDYLFLQGGGSDKINDTSGFDRIVAGPGLSATNLNISRYGQSLVVDFGLSDRIVIENVYVDGSVPSGVERIVFADSSEVDLTQRAVAIGGTDNRDWLVGTELVDGLSGFGGDDTLEGMGGNDFILGGTGNDELSGGSGMDVLDGGPGDDRIFGGASGSTGRSPDTVGSDLVLFGRGDGRDTVWFTRYGTDVIRFKPGVLPQDVLINHAVTQPGSSFFVGIRNSAEGLQVALNGYEDDLGVEEIRFEDAPGVVWRASEIKAALQASSSGNDYLLGFSGEDVLDGGDGNDTLSGRSGNDQLTGGTGNDFLSGGNGNDELHGGVGDDSFELFDDGNDRYEGGPGNDLFYNSSGYGSLGSDTFVFNRGDGSDRLIGSQYYSDSGAIDVLQFGPGISSSDIAISPYGVVGFTVSIKGTADSVDVQQQLQGFDNGLIDEIRFTDDPGTVLRRADWLQLSLQNGPTEGNDTLRGTTGNDTIDALGGDDNVSGDAGDDTLSGGAGNDQLFGESGNDLLDGGLGNDTTAGGPGNDILIVDSGSDVVAEFAGEGIDTVQSSVTFVLPSEAENLTLTGTAAINATGNTVANVLTGNSAANRIDGGAGADTMSGGAGSDIYIVDDSLDVITEAAGAGTDLVESSVGHTLAASVENLTLTGTGAINATGNSLANVLTGNSGANRLDGAAGADSMAGGGGDDVYIVDNVLDVATEMASAGADRVESSVAFTLGANLENLTLTGTSAIDGTGNTLANVLTGNTAANRLNGGSGADMMAGGAGNDTYVVDNAGDVVTEGAGTGTDTVESESSITHSLGVNVENLTLNGTSSINATGNSLANVLTGNSGANRLDGGSAADTMIGGSGNDTYVVDNAGDVVTELASGGTDKVEATISYTLGVNVENLTLNGTSAINGTGNTLNNVLTGNSAANTLTGSAGNDTLNGGAGIDAMVGGAGNDTYVVDVAGDMVTELASEGTDTIQTALTYTLGANVENLTLTGAAAVSGTGNDLNNVITGNTANNVLTGGLGNDTLNGGAGIDTMIGGTGNDTYVVDVTGDVITELANEGTDTIQTALTYALGANIENLTLTGTAAVNGTGNSSNNTLTGNSAANVLTGGAGNDSLNGGAGADTLIGGAGNDTYTVDNAGDVMTELANEGTDLVRSSITRSLGANLENLTLTGSSAINGTGNTLNNVLTGNSAANTLAGGAGNDTLNGGAGADTLIGGTGNDIYTVDNASEVVTELANEGTDLVNSSITWTLGANLEKLTLTGTGAINGTGNTLNNVLTGNSAANTLTGGTGDDTLNGAAGADTLVGGAGNDTYAVDNVGDVTTELANQGTDLVNSSITWTLAANVENLTLTGSSAISGAGNTLNNVITGNNAANTLTGGSGNDTLNGGAGGDAMIGGAGNDTYVIDSSSDVTTELSNEGTDTVQSSITHTLAANVENLTLTGTSAINGTGNASNNSLVGNSAANVLNGGSGADTMAGGAGNDTYVVDNAGDVTTELASAGTDFVQSSSTWTLAANVENLALTGTSAINGTGNTLDNVLTGNTANNTLSGAAGNDTLTDSGGANVYIGGAGNDTLNVTSTGVDRIAVARGHGTDVVIGSGTAAADVLEVSNGIVKADMGLMKSGNDLIVDLGAGETVALRNWYAGVRNVGTLKIIGDAGWVPGQIGAATLLETLDLVSLASQFDAARTTDPTLTRWAIDPAMRGMSAQLTSLAGDEDFVSFRTGYGRNLGTNLSLLHQSGSPPNRAKAPPLNQRAPFVFADTPSDSQHANLGSNSMQPNMKQFLQFWNRADPADVSTADWFANLLADAENDTTSAGSVGKESSFATIGLGSRSEAAATDAEPGSPVICQIPSDDPDAAGTTAESIQVAVEGWVLRPPAARQLAAPDEEVGMTLARIQPVARSPEWWNSWTVDSAMPIAGKVEKLPYAIAPLAWEIVHEQLASELAVAPEYAIGVQLQPSALTGTSSLQPIFNDPDLGGVAGDPQMLTGRLRKALV